MCVQSLQMHVLEDYSKQESDAREKRHGGLNKWDSSAEQGRKKNQIVRQDDTGNSEN